jgi:histidine ammonia-lyase
MTVKVTGGSLTIDEVIRVARRHEDVELDPAARERMTKARGVVEAAFARGDAVYGLTTGVGVLKRVSANAEQDAVDFEGRLLRFHDIAQEPSFSDDAVRAAALRVVNQLALGTIGVRPAASRRTGRSSRVRCSIGSICGSSCRGCRGT